MTSPWLAKSSTAVVLSKRIMVRAAEERLVESLDPKKIKKVNL